MVHLAQYFTLKILAREVSIFEFINVRLCLEHKAVCIVLYVFDGFC